MATNVASYVVDLLQDSKGRLPKSYWSPQIGHLRPECVGEDGVVITDDGAHDAVELDNIVEEDFGDRDRGVRVT
jgi:hypothetical protein